MTSRTKGANAEREVAVILQDWWRRRDPVATFRRTPQSGGWQHAPEFRAAGDIVCTSPEWPFCVEVKRHEAWTLGNVVKGRRSPVWAWWDQALRQGREARLVPLLVWRKSRRPWHVMLPHDMGLPWPHGWLDIPPTEHSVRDGCGGPPIVVPLADLVSIDPSAFGRGSRA